MAEDLWSIYDRFMMIYGRFMEDLWWNHAGFMVDLWKIYSRFMVDLRLIHAGYVEDLWRIHGRFMVDLRRIMVDLWIIIFW